ncbi:Gx transporter family protein [Sporosalibacterium faouarense]|uniref:Gx transporter family protein n=1 Tax=Sporosalibacterium faouarense TaxID=516123 RepID=UPI00141C5583|nr:Gx transporter family protein [Sporosalibacterium faouarense]MTI48518.1 Gx transporter family protein [Bacillota bacterium]
MSRIKKLVFLSLLVSVGLALSIIESTMPVPFLAPGAKLGLSNMVVLTTLVIFGFKEAFAVAVIRSLTFALATGGFSGLFYSLAGAILSVIVMGIVFKFFKNFFSLIGVSIFGAMAHNIAQIGVASIIMENIKIFSYLPIMSLVSLFTGYFVGLSSIMITRTFEKNFSKIINY